MKKTGLIRLLIAIAATFAAFAYLIYGLANLQLIRGEEYADDAGVKSIKTIRTTGKRGMITDADSVILAMTEDVYNVTFYRTSAQSTAAYYKKFTRSIIEGIQIIEKYGGELCVSFVIERDENGLWQYNFGRGISESSWNIRMKQFRANHYISESKYDDAQAAFEHLYKRYQFAA
ncbi:MAG: hypothetical protein IJS53_03965, partial [Clostridia bacterium]|nr:hypothetical protein [Clostridia bacterium]